jgi:protein-S-isoprenylcysteine O-methyltransferase Ste14
MGAIRIVIFTVAILLELVLCGSLILTLRYPKHRIWPPPKKNSWQYWYIHTLTETSIFFVLILGILDWNTSFLTHESRFVFASLLIAVGGTTYLWSLRTLSVNTSLGLKGKLTTHGPYEYSRNPQYVGAILFFVGSMIVFNSIYAYITGTIGIALFILAPFTEEPWLQQQYKGEYDEYCRKVPRFIKIL